MEFRRSVLDALIFGAIAVFTLIGGGTSIVDAVHIRSWPLGIFGGMALLLSGLMAYEAAALAFGLPTLSYLTNREYLGHPLVFIAVLFLVTVVIGALAMHFTVRDGRFDAKVALIAVAGLLLGCTLAVAGRWRVL
jgi:hypothetical protein